MKRALRRWTMFAVLVAAFASAPNPGASRAASGAMAVIVHPDTPVDGLSFGEMRRIFLGQRQYWNPNVPVVLIVRAPEARERQVVLKKIYEMSESQFKQYWIARIFRDEATATPKVVYSNQTLNDLVAAIPGAIGLVSADDVRPGVKVVRIDGAMPGESKYPLR